MRRVLPTLLGISLILFFGAVLFNRSENTFAALSTHVVISEVQVAGATTTDEFIEIYNPTGSDVNLSNWRLGRKTQSGTNATDLVSSLSGTIESHGYFLIASDSYTGAVVADVTYASASSSIANNNSVTLYDGSDTTVDLVGLGSSTASETATIGNPSTSNSVERKANSSSDATSMGSGGTDEFAGNGEDTDNNSSDFVSRTTPQPQNSQATPEPIGVSPTPTETPTPTLSPTPSIEPSVTPSVTPSATPTETPTPTPSPTITPSPTPTLSPTPSVPAPKVIVSGPLFSCSINYKPWRFFGKTFFFPSISCSRTI